jgi:hypothetical protein
LIFINCATPKFFFLPPPLDGSKAVEEEVAFTPAIAGRSYRALHFGSCKMEVLVAWGLFSSRKFLENVTIVILLLFDKKYLIKAN